MPLSAVISAKTLATVAQNATQQNACNAEYTVCSNAKAGNEMIWPFVRNVFSVLGSFSSAIYNDRKVKIDTKKTITNDFSQANGQKI